MEDADGTFESRMPDAAFHPRRLGSLAQIQNARSPYVRSAVSNLMSALFGPSRISMGGDQSSPIVFLDPPPFWKATEDDNAMLGPPDALAGMGARMARAVDAVQSGVRSESQSHSGD
jgi:hypothetical protein